LPGTNPLAYFKTAFETKNEMLQLYKLKELFIFIF
jgi:hypothetical protein